MNNTNPPGETESSSQPEIIIPVNFLGSGLRIENIITITIVQGLMLFDLNCAFDGI